MKMGVKMYKSILLSVLATLFASQVVAAKIPLNFAAGSRRANMMRADSVSGAPEKSLLREFTVLRSEAPECAPLSVGDELVVTVFDDVELTLKIKARQPDPLGGGASFSAEIAGCDGISSASVVQTPEGLQIHAHDFKKDRVYTIFTGSGDVKVRELQPSLEGPTKDSVPKEPPEPTEAEREAALRNAAVSRDASIGVADASTPVYVDMLIAYDSSAASWAKSNGGGITNFANSVVSKMNTVLGNTGLSSYFQYRLLGVKAVSVSGGKDFDGTLDNVVDGVGSWSPIKSMRESIGADVVTTFINIGNGDGTTGIGYCYLPEYASFFSSHAYNVCSIQHANSGYVVSHEVGHNMGCGHSDKQTSSPGPQYYAYSSGYYFTASGTKYHTIMAYNWDGYGNYYTAAPLFSSPNHSYKGVKAGTSARNDNTRTLKENYLAVSKFRTATETVKVTFDANGGSVSASSQTYTIGSTYGSFPTATRSGYSFAGWFTSASGGTQVLSSSTVSASQTTLYAHWSSKPDLYFSAPSGWTKPVFLATDASSLSPATSFAHGDTVYLRYSIGNKGQSKVSTPFKFFHQVVNSSGSVVASYSEDSGSTDLLDPNGISYISSGWKWSGLQNLSAGSYTYKLTIDSGNVVAESDEGNNNYSLTFSITTPTTVVVTFDANGGTVSPTTKAYDIGSSYAWLPTPTRSGYTFAGWYTTALTGGTRIYTTTTVGASTTVLYARWTQTPGGDTPSGNGFTIVDGVLTAWDGSGSTDVVIPSGVTEIGQDAFRSSAITSVTIPSGVRKIGQGAFIMCYSLAKVTLAAGLEEICGQAFAFDRKLTEIVVPDTVRTIGFCAFSWCSGLRKVTLSAALEKISWGTFEYCTALEGVYYRGQRAPDFEFSFHHNQYEGANASIVTYVPYGSTGWQSPDSSALPSTWPLDDEDARPIANWTPDGSGTVQGLTLNFTSSGGTLTSDAMTNGRGSWYFNGAGRPDWITGISVKDGSSSITLGKGTLNYRGGTALKFAVTVTANTGAARSWSMPISDPEKTGDGVIGTLVINQAAGGETTGKPDMRMAPAANWPYAVYVSSQTKSFVEQWSFEIGEKIYFYACFENCGTADCTKKMIIRHEVLDVTGKQLSCWDYEDDCSAESFPAGDMRCWFGGEWTALNGLPKGEYVYRVTMDAENALDELDESNNSASFAFTVGGKGDDDDDDGDDDGDDGSYGPFGSDANVVRDAVAPTMLVQVAVTIKGKTALAGDCVAVYREDTGALCGLGRVLDNSGKVTIALNVNAGVALHFKVWQAASGIRGEILEGDVESDFISPVPGTILTGRKLVVSGSNSLTFALSGAKWHQISFNVIPPDASPASVFAPVSDAIDFVIAGGNYWSPDFGGTLESVEVGEGYWVCTTEDSVSWTVSGVAKPSAEIELGVGWTLIGYAPKSSGSPAVMLKTALSSGKISYIAYNSLVYPGSLSTMTPGQAYWVYSETGGKISYDVSDASNSITAFDDEGYGPFGTEEAVVREPVAPTILVDMSVDMLGSPASVGDCVAVYRRDTDELCGLGRVGEDGKVTIAVNVSMGVKLYFKAWQASGGLSGDVLTADASYDIEASQGIEKDRSVAFVGEGERVTVYFDPNGGSISWLSQQYTIGKPYGLFPDIYDRTGYYFVGWFTERTGGVLKTNSSVAEASVTTLYAHWASISDTGSLNLTLPSAGWHEVSFNVLPAGGAPEDVFSTVEGEIGYLTYGSRNWNPETAGTLTELEIGKGYWVQTTADNVSWTVSGYGNPDVEIALKAGWNLIGYPLLKEGEIETVLATALATGDIRYIYSGSRVYPGTLTTMTPGKGYWVYANAAVSIKFNGQ